MVGATLDFKQVNRRVSLSDLELLAQRVQAVVSQARQHMLRPTEQKVEPTLNVAQLAELCNIDKAHINYRVTRGDLPSGTVRGGRREWPLSDGLAWVKEYRAGHLRPEGAGAVTLCLANFKGGVSKTVTSVTLAQGLAALGHKILLIDLDPQGSATTLFGILPDVDVAPEMSTLPLFAGDQNDLVYATQRTYWPGVDLIAAAPLLFEAEFHLPNRQRTEEGFEFWRCLDRALDVLRPAYDIIVIDTPPSLSYLTLNGLFASDGVIMPLPPNLLDFASSALFWNMFSDIGRGLMRNRGEKKVYEFVDVLVSRAEPNDTATAVIRRWLAEGYEEKLLPIVIPKTAATATASIEFGTVYDVQRGSMSAKTFTRAKTIYDQLCLHVETQIEAVWARQLELIGGNNADQGQGSVLVR